MKCSPENHRTAGVADPSDRSASQHVPAATYRLQFNSNFTFVHAGTIVDYLSELGISDCYASPLFLAGSGSTHGYDICSFERLNPALGGDEGFARFVANLQNFGLGLLLDIVPNHMGADLCNGWWRDVLEKGESSPYATWFDIEWEPLNPELHGKVLLPVLEDHYARVLEAGKLKIAFDEGGFVVAYYDRRFPLSLSSYRPILRQLLARCGTDAKGIQLFDKLQNAAEDEFRERMPAILCSLNDSPELRKALAGVLHDINGAAGMPRSFDQLHFLLQQQYYRLAYWRVAAEECNYRRFFDVSEMVSLRMELAEVFQASHQMILRLIAERKITGLRIDHPDGLWNPKQYFERIRSFCAPAAESNRQSRLYIVAEKILNGDEFLPLEWPVQGTTGYDFLNRLNGLFVNGLNRTAFDRLYHEFTGDQRDFKTLVYTSKKQVLLNSFSAELDGLASRLKWLAGSTRYGQDFTVGQLRTALAELIAVFPVYRTYVEEDTLNLSGADREFITEALLAAQKRNRDLDPKVFEFLGNLLRLQLPEDLDEESRKGARDFVMKLQQLTGPVMAKGLEDTAFYNFNRLISLNEVGGEPDNFGVSTEAFHFYNSAKAEHWPHSLLATSTHDTKRGEDARARINVLSEIPDDWREAVLRWSRLNNDKKPLIDGRSVPERSDEYLLYQTLVGAWLPDAETATGLRSLCDRIAAYMLKATREAKAYTSWMNPNHAYEEGTRKFIENVLATSASNAFLNDFKKFHPRISFFGHLNSLGQTLIKMTAPGVPDFYQGTELWDFSLVDPDNRRPVDFDLRRRMLMDLRERLRFEALEMRELLSQLWEKSDTGLVKLYLIWRVLDFRRRHRELFERGAYLPLSASGPKRNHVCAFARVLGDKSSITVVPRLILRLLNGAERLPMGQTVWLDTYLEAPSLPPSFLPSAAPQENIVEKLPAPPDAEREVQQNLFRLAPGQRFRNVLTNEEIELPAGEVGLRLDGVLGLFPVALLELLS